MRALWLADKLRAHGLEVVEHDGWRERGKPGLQPMVVVAHHTAGAAKGDAPSLKLCIDGRADLAGPLCHVLLARSGTCHVIASGIANHAGAGGWMGSTGNSSALGIEAEHTGLPTELWPPNQLVAYHKACAALLDGIGKNERFVCGHKEWAPKRKVDPIGLDMDAFRRHVADYLIPSKEKNDMAELSDADVERIANACAVAVVKKLSSGSGPKQLDGSNWTLDEIGGDVLAIKQAVVGS